MTINREYKDRLFKFIFGREENKEWALSLYNAVNGTSYSSVDDLVLTTIDDALYMGMKDDVSFLFADHVNIYEQQSTLNPNMPLRYLMYAGMIYSGYVATKHLNLFSTQVKKIPAPRNVCFYNGVSDMEDRMEYRLSDAFINKEKGDIEVVVLMININYGRNKEFLAKCKPLDEYSWFVSEINKNQKESGDMKRAVDKALDDMPDDYVIKPFLMAHRAEVEIMCITEYNETETMNLFKEEGIEEGIAIGEVRGEARGEARGVTKGRVLQLISLTQKGLLSEDVAAKEADMSLDEFKRCEKLYCS